MGERVQVEISGGIAEVRLMRAEKINALDDAMFSEIIAAGERLKHETGVRAVVLSGDGRGFCAGLDMASFAQLAGSIQGGGLLDLPRTPAGANRVQQAAYVWREVPVPVIAAIHGVAFGGGFQIALGPDLRFVAADARLSVMEIKWGLVPDMAGIVLLRGLVRDDVARELTFSGRVFSGEEAWRLGLATRVCADPRAEALAFAGEIAAKSPHAIRAAKRLFNFAADAVPSAIFKAETDEQVGLIGSPNQIEAVMANLEKRAAKFQD